MNILFLTYWGFHDGLTISTVMPHIRILEQNIKIESIILCTIERDVVLSERRLSDKVLHIPLMSSNLYRAKISDFIRFPNKIAQLILQHQIRFMFCRGTPAGALGYLVHCKVKIEYAVESFEPHADYMLESKVWSRLGLRYLLQKYWEKMQLKTARFIMPVSQQYYDCLIAENVPERKLLLMPCAVNSDKFALNNDNRILVRQRLGLGEEDIVGIYVGKFGGMYYENEAFHIFSQAKKYFEKLHLIILSPDNHQYIEDNLVKAGYLEGDYYIKHIPHSEVPAYLSASDFAFATYKPGYFKRYLSPVKVGEYWASGLPVLLTDGIGDDHIIVEKLNIGAVFSYQEDELERAFEKLGMILSEGRFGTYLRIHTVAKRYRNFDNNALVYRRIIDNMI